MTENRHTESIVPGRVRRLSESQLFARSTAGLGTWQTVVWWEARRVPYNLLIGATGFISAGLCFATGLVCEHFLGEPIGIPDPPFLAPLAVIAYGLMANLCYTGGWAAELLVRKIWPDEATAFGKISFFLGLIFSILLTLIPGIVIPAIGAIRLAEHFFGK